MDLGLTGRVVVLTGATSGLGLATARVLVDEGARVVVSSRSAERVEETVRMLGAAATGVAVGLGDADAPQRLLDAAGDRLDGLLISVGGPPPGPATGPGAVPDEQWREAFESVFLGAVRLARAAAGRMSAGGSIAFVLSSSVRAPLGGLAVSNGLRPGLAMLAKTMADELGPAGIRVNGLLPGRFGTERVTFLDEATGDPAGARRSAEQGIPLRRYGDPAEFGRVAAFLLSPAASYVTGSMLTVDGGATRAL